MKKSASLRCFAAGALLLALFVLFTLALTKIDVSPIGPRGSTVGFSTLNGYVHSLLGVHWLLYTVTDWLGFIPLLAALGLWQLIRRRSLFLVDRSILVLGVFSILVFAAYFYFEAHSINYRPVLINGRLEASYPSSTTLLVLCVMPTAMLQLRTRLRRGRFAADVLIVIFMIFMVAGRLISGVHWFTDILGSILLSTALVCLYRGAVGILCTEK